MDPIERAFWHFHWTNPDVYKELVKMSHALRDVGRQHYGIACLFEVIRYHRDIKTTDPVFKLNNNHKALYARLLMANEPDLKGFFQLRERTAQHRR
jgi:hypothetical protein